MRFPSSRSNTCGLLGLVVWFSKARTEMSRKTCRWDPNHVVHVLSRWLFLFSQPLAGTPITGKGVVICKYPSDPTVVLGYLSVAFLAISTFAGWYSLFYPYQGKSVPQATFFQNKGFLVFFNVAVATTGLAATFLLWPTIQEQLHHVRNVHHNLETNCPTAKTGILGGGAFLSLDSCLFWLVALMLADNVRADYFDESEEKIPTSYGTGEPLKAIA